MVNSLLYAFLSALPEIKFEWTFSLGQIVAVGTGLLMAKPALNFYRTILIFMAEHEALISMVCEQHGIKREDFARKALTILDERTLKAKAAGVGR